MKIHKLPRDPGRRGKNKRVGRGESSGYGKTSGRGSKGALARAGAKKVKNFEGGQMPLSRRVPKRGFFNIFRKNYTPVNLEVLENRFEDGAMIDPEILVQKGVIKKSEARIKILGSGELTKKFTIKSHAFSKSAEEKIKAGGGKCEVIPC